MFSIDQSTLFFWIITLLAGSMGFVLKKMIDTVITKIDNTFNLVMAIKQESSLLNYRVEQLEQKKATRSKKDSEI